LRGADGFTTADVIIAAPEVVVEEVVVMEESVEELAGGRVNPISLALFPTAN
jgi:hypothetical protein